MRVLLPNGVAHRVLATHVGWFLTEGDYHEVLITPESEGRGSMWVCTDRVKLDLNDPTTRRLLECTSDGSSASSSGGSNSASKSSSSASSTDSSASSDSNSLDLDAILTRLSGSMSGHVSDMGWKLLAHAERDILDLVAEVKRLRARE